MSTLDDQDLERIREVVEAAALPLRNDVGRHEKALFGNGNPGLVTEMAGIAEWKKNANRAFFGILGAIAGFILGPR